MGYIFLMFASAGAIIVFMLNFVTDLILGMPPNLLAFLIIVFAVVQVVIEHKNG